MLNSTLLLFHVLRETFLFTWIPLDNGKLSWNWPPRSPVPPSYSYFYLFMNLVSASCFCLIIRAQPLNENKVREISLDFCVNDVWTYEQCELRSGFFSLFFSANLDRTYGLARADVKQCLLCRPPDPCRLIGTFWFIEQKRTGTEESTSLTFYLKWRGPFFRWPVRRLPRLQFKFQAFPVSIIFC